MHIHIFGSSGSGVTTLGNALSQKMNVPYIDTDDYYWEKTNPPFQVRIEAGIRNARLLADLNNHAHWILGGSLDSWVFPVREFDRIVFLWLPNHIRTTRLINREKERYGEVLSEQSKDFIDWALAYDDNNRHGRNRQRHEQWIQTLTCPVLRIEGDMEVEEKVGLVTEWLSNEKVLTQ